ncbi:MAG: hypothetical protein QFB86_04380 [Patescibacteria group bacterium]|nr:hypothetical protein [Patescibacteria group bacterium]
MSTHEYEAQVTEADGVHPRGLLIGAIAGLAMWGAFIGGGFIIKEQIFDHPPQSPQEQTHLSTLTP